jgi:hypothetical protein
VSESFFSKDYWIAATISYHRMQMQAVTGIGFDKGQAVGLAERIEGMMKEIEAEIEPKLPERPLNKGETDYWRIPAKPFNKDGTLSATMQRWMDSRQAKLTTQRDIILEDGQVFPIIGGSETKTKGKMTLANQDDLKDWLIRDCGWKPTLWNVKKDARGKPMRDDKGNVIQTSPKMQENGKLCPNLEALQGDLVKPVVKWLSLRNRKSVIEGWLEQPRLEFDGRLPAGSTGLATSHRQKHNIVCNVPKADPSVTLGVEMRQLFVASRPGYVLLGWDASGIEARVEAHYCYPYEGGKEYAEELIDGDIHMKTMMGVYWDKVSHLYGTDRWNKDDPEIKPWRNRSKNIKYASGYGAQPPKLASMLGCSVDEAKDVYERFWSAAKPLAILKERLTMAWEQNGKKYIKALDGRKLLARSKHARVNLQFQSAGAIIMDYSLMFLDRKLGGLVLDKHDYPCYSYKGRELYRSIYYHDEVVLEVPEEMAEELRPLVESTIPQAGKYLKMRVPLAAEAKYGPSWASIH